MSINRVCIGVDAFAVPGGPLHGNFEGYFSLRIFGLKRNNFVVNNFRLLDLIEIFNIILQTVLIKELNRFWLCITFISKSNLQALVEESHLLKTDSKRIKVILDRFKNIVICPETNGRS